MPAKNKHKKVTVDTSKANLKRRIRQHLQLLGFKKDKRGDLIPPALTKENIRALHSYQRKVGCTRFPGHLVKV